MSLHAMDSRVFALLLARRVGIRALLARRAAVRAVLFPVRKLACRIAVVNVLATGAELHHRPHRTARRADSAAAHRVGHLQGMRVNA